MSRHRRPSRWRRLREDHSDLLAIVGIIMCLIIGTILLLWLSSQRIKGVG